MQKDQTIGAAIIAKNNDATIAATLQSIQRLCQQIVIVDTGSSDRTSEIALKYGAEIHYSLWNNSFAEARNHALEFLRTDWILIIDTDEILKSFNLDEFNNITNNPDCGGIKVQIDNLLENGLISRHEYPRIIRNDKRIKFQGNIHEQVSESIERAGMQIYKSNICIEHTGYKEKNQEKIDRNKQLLESQLKQNGDDWTKYHLANTEFSNGELSQAERHYLQIEGSPELSDFQNENTKIRLAQIYLKQEKLSLMREKLFFQSEDVNLEGFRNYLLLVYHLSMNEFREAESLSSLSSISASNLVDKKQLQQITDLINKL